ncbi:YPL264C, partial [Symbiodinium pilosum]
MAAAALPLAARFYTPPALSPNGHMKIVPRPLVATNWQAIPQAIQPGNGIQRQIFVQGPESSTQWRQFPTAPSATPKVLVVQQSVDGTRSPATRSPAGSFQEDAKPTGGREASPEREEGFRKRGGEGRSSGGGPSSLNFSTPSKVAKARKASAATPKERGGTGAQATASRNSPRGQGSRRTSSVCALSPRREKAKEAPKERFSPAWPVVETFAREEVPRQNLRSDCRDACTRAESPHDCIASARSRSPEMDGVMRRSGAGRSSGGGPSSICLGDTPSRPPQLRIPQRAFSADGPMQASRDPGWKEPRRRQSDMSVKSLSTYCPEDTPCVAVSATDAGEERSMGYEDVFAENRLLRAENARLQSELEKCDDWAWL